MHRYLSSPNFLFIAVLALVAVHGLSNLAARAEVKTPLILGEKFRRLSEIKNKNNTSRDPSTDGSKANKEPVDGAMDQLNDENESYATDPKLGDNTGSTQNNGSSADEKGRAVGPDEGGDSNDEPDDKSGDDVAMRGLEGGLLDGFLERGRIFSKGDETSTGRIPIFGKITSLVGGLVNPNEKENEGLLGIFNKTGKDKEGDGLLGGGLLGGGLLDLNKKSDEDKNKDESTGDDADDGKKRGGIMQRLFGDFSLIGRRKQRN